MKLILIGAPGAGKGSHAKLISKKYKIPQISMGDIIREDIKKGTKLGKELKKFTEKGNLVTDDLVIRLLESRINKKDCSNGYILDGFPRTIAQANALEKITEIDNVLLLDCSEKTVLQRLVGRRNCNKCGAIFHVINMPPKKEGVCDKCGGKLFQRGDDQEKTIKNRLKVYKRKTAPLINFYKKKGLLKKVNANNTLDIAFKDIINALNK